MPSWRSSPAKAGQWHRELSPGIGTHIADHSHPRLSHVKQVEENAKAMEFGPLTPEQMKRIEVILKRA